MDGQQFNQTASSSGLRPAAVHRSHAASAASGPSAPKPQSLLLPRAELRPSEIGRRYVSAARRLRQTNEFGAREDGCLTRLRHTFDESRRQLPPDAQQFATQIERLVAQVERNVPDAVFQSDFVVNLEAFSRIAVPDENDDTFLCRVAFAYVPVRLAAVLTHVQKGQLHNFYFPDVSCRPSFVPRAFRIQHTVDGLTVSRPIGFLWAFLLMFLTLLPAVLYAWFRARGRTLEDILQTVFAILAATLFGISPPLHRFLFNNWGIRYSMRGAMLLDVDTIRNIRSEPERRRLAIALLLCGRTDLLCGSASYALPFSRVGLDGGPMMLSVLTVDAGNQLIVDQDGEIVLCYEGNKSVALCVWRDDELYDADSAGMRGALLELEPVSAIRYSEHRWWYVLCVKHGSDAGCSLVY